MPPILETRFFKLLEKILRFVLIFTGIAIVLLVTYYVITRYLLGTNFNGFEELCILIVVWMYFFGAANASREQSHISADMLDLFVKNPPRFSSGGHCPPGHLLFSRSCNGLFSLGFHDVQRDPRRDHHDSQNPHGVLSYFLVPWDHIDGRI